MTIVCAITDGERTWLGSDRQVTMGDAKVLLREGKWVETPSGWWVGHSGWARMADLAESCVERSYDARGLARTLRQRIADDGWQPLEGDGPIEHAGRALIARPGELWLMDSSGAVMRCPNNELAAIGRGEGAALGAALGWSKALDAVGTVAECGELTRIAVRSANKYAVGCGRGEWSKELRP